MSTVISKREGGFGIIMVIMMLAVIGAGGYFGAEPAMAKYDEIMGGVRDGRRMHELRNMMTITMSEYVLKGKSPSKDGIMKFLKDTSPKNWADPNNTIINCLDSTYVKGQEYKKRTCRYQYAQCDRGKGFVFRGQFEAGENIANYTKDDLENKGSKDYYDVGTCEIYPKSDDAFVDIK